MHRKLPSSRTAREALRQKGQFWTPDWVAEAMAAYVIHAGAGEVFDPAVGEGALLRAAKKVAGENGQHVKLIGTEVDAAVLKQALANGLTAEDLSNVEIRDFLLDAPAGPFPAIVANPPYIRHHRLNPELKSRLRVLGAKLIGKALDGRAGVHVYFLLRALTLLAPQGRLAFIMPADTCEGIFARDLWNWITNNFCLEAVITFSSEASPFQGVDINPVIFMLSKKMPADSFWWVRCFKPDTEELKLWIISGFAHFSGQSLELHRRSIQEALTTGLSRQPVCWHENAPILGQFARVVRGVATGANDFFFLTKAQAHDLKIPAEFLLPAIGRTRDARGETITQETLKALEKANRPTLLFAPDARPMHAFPKAVQDYLERGAKAGLPERPLIASRYPWYKMEHRCPPPILFAYLGRRNARFIRNLAGVVPLTGFLCVYPRSDDPDFLEKLWRVLQHPRTVSNLALVGKSYGDGCIKVEPRALESLPLPPGVVRSVGLTAADPQLSLIELQECAASVPGSLHDKPLALPKARKHRTNTKR